MRAERRRTAERRRVAIVTPAYVSSTPRVVREADALAGAGFDVRVVFSQGQLEALRAFDETLLAEKPWRSSVVRWSNSRPQESWAYYRSGLRHRVAQALPSALHVPGLAERAEGRVYPELTAAAASEPADLFIGHYPVGLAAASHAARRYQALVGYDVEDLYAETRPDVPEWARQRDRVLELEDRYVGTCAYASVVSGPVASEFARRFPALPAVLVHNCHPWADRDRMDGRVLERAGEELSLFWFSQTVGLDRGLQDAIRAMALSGVPMQLHLRGNVSPDIQAALVRLAEESGVVRSVHFHPACPPEELLSRASEHDVGLALETDSTVNRRLTVSNKMFLYMTAGLALSVSDLPGQRSVLESAPAAGRLHAVGDVEALAGHLRRWALEPAALADARQASLDAARSRWNFERESEALIATVDAALAGSGLDRAQRAG